MHSKINYIIMPVGLWVNVKACKHVERELSMNINYIDRWALFVNKLQESRVLKDEYWKATKSFWSWFKYEEHS